MPVDKTSTGLLLAVAMLSSRMLAQPAPELRGSGVHGRVLDSGRTPIVGANITALPDDGRAPGHPAVSDKDGEFSIALDPGFYTFEIVAPGFREIWETVVLRRPQVESRDFILQAGSSHVRKKK
jgi:hypothetical protein